MSEVTEKELIANAESTGGRRVTKEALDLNVKEVFVARASELFDVVKGHPLECLTICIAVTQNGFTLLGKSGCADPASYNAEIGESLAEEDAIKQLWALMGYNLKQELYQESGNGGDFKSRLNQEHKELNIKLNKLEAFIGGNEQFAQLSEEAQYDLVAQREAMTTYRNTLSKRILALG